MATIHISEAEAAGDFAGLMARVRAGAEVVIESGSLAVAVMHPFAPPRRSLSESIALAEAHAKERGNVQRQALRGHTRSQDRLTVVACLSSKQAQP